MKYCTVSQRGRQRLGVLPRVPLLNQGLEGLEDTLSCTLAAFDKFLGSLTHGIGGLAVLEQFLKH